MTRPHRARALERRVAPFVRAALVVGLAGMAAIQLEAFIPSASLLLLLLLAILFVAVREGLWPSLAASVMANLFYNFFFITPRYTFTVSRPEEVLNLGVFLVVAVFSSRLAGRVRDQALLAERREARVRALHELGREIAAARDLSDVTRVVVTALAARLELPVFLYLEETDRPPEITTEPATLVPSRTEIAAAERAAAATEPTEAAPWYFLPLHTVTMRLGSVGVRAGDLDLEKHQLLEGMVGLAAIGIERARLARDNAEAALLAQTEKLRHALLLSLSHDLRTPLVSIIGSASTLLDQGDRCTPEIRRELLETVRDEGDRMHRYVRNLLDIMRIESGALELRRDWVEIGDLIGATLDSTSRIVGTRTVKVNCPPDLPMLRLDFVLMEQVLVNLIENATRHSPGDRPILIAARTEEDRLVIEVEDDGPGVPPGEVERIFEKFHRIPSGFADGGGIGLGLAICRGIVEAHGGRIACHSPAAAGHGTVFRMIFPVDPSPPLLEAGA